MINQVSGAIAIAIAVLNSDSEMYCIVSYQLDCRLAQVVMGWDVTRAIAIREGYSARSVRSDLCVFINGDVELSLFIVMCCVVFGIDDPRAGQPRGERCIWRGRGKPGLAWVGLLFVPLVYRVIAVLNSPDVLYHIPSPHAQVSYCRLAYVCERYSVPWRTARGPRGESCGGASVSRVIICCDIPGQ